MMPEFRRLTGCVGVKVRLQCAIVFVKMINYCAVSLSILSFVMNRAWGEWLDRRARGFTTQKVIVRRQSQWHNNDGRHLERAVNV